MSAVRWQRDQAVALVDPLAVDALGGHVLVLEGITAEDDRDLEWCTRAPCVVIGCTPSGEPPSEAVDVVLVGDQVDRELDALVARIGEQRRAARVLVDVLRAMPALDAPAGLVLESLAYSMLLAGPDFAAWLATRPEATPRRFDGPAVRAERSGAELRLTLARPENRNAFSAAMRDALYEALTLAVVDDSVERVVLDGEGPVFSSGGDLGEFGTAADVVRAHEVRTRRSVGRLLADLAPRVTVQLRGACVGAGVELSAFAGRVVADPGTTFRLPEVGMGLIPGAGGTVSVTRRIGREQAARFALLGEPIDAEEALALGLVDEIAPVPIS